MLWRILSELKDEELPIQWRDFSFFDFTLVVETPFRDFEFPNPNPEDAAFVGNSHDGYAWINDICRSRSPRVSQEVFNNRQCSPEIPHSACNHHGRQNCPPSLKISPYPQCRPEIKRTFKPWFQ